MAGAAKNNNHNHNNIVMTINQRLIQEQLNLHRELLELKKQLKWRYNENL